MKVLCAVDGSAGSDAAVMYVGELFSGGRDEVLLYFAPPTVNVRGASAEDHRILDETARSLADKVFARAMSALPADLRERTKTILGHQKPRHGILAAVRRLRPDLIAMGARGANRLGLARLGSVSRGVVHASEIPVLVARAQDAPRSGPLKVMVACDPTELSSNACEFLNQLKFPESTVGRVVHVTESLFGGGLPEWLEKEIHETTDPIAKQFEQRQQEETDRWTETLVTHARELPGVFHDTRPVILKGHPGEQLAKYAQSEGFDLIVVGTRSQGAVMRMIAGSTSEYVLSNATCAVLIIPIHEQP